MRLSERGVAMSGKGFGRRTPLPDWEGERHQSAVEMSKVSETHPRTPFPARRQVYSPLALKGQTPRGYERWRGTWTVLPIAHQDTRSANEGEYDRIRAGGQNTTEKPMSKAETEKREQILTALLPAPNAKWSLSDASLAML